MQDKTKQAQDDCKRQSLQRILSYEKGQMHSSFRDHFMTKFQALDTTFSCTLFRMSRFDYETLQTMLGPWLQPKLAQQNIDAWKGSNLQPLTIDKIICISLCIFGGAAYVDITWGFNVSVSSLYFNFFRLPCKVKCWYCLFSNNSIRTASSFQQDGANLNTS